MGLRSDHMRGFRGGRGSGPSQHSMDSEINGVSLTSP